MSAPTPPPVPTGKKSRTGWIVAGVVALVLGVPLALGVVAAVWIFRIIPEPKEKKVDFRPSETNEAFLRQAEMEEDIRKLRDSLDEKKKTSGSPAPAAE